MQELQEMQVQSLDREDPLEEETATHPSIREDRGAQRTIVQRVVKSQTWQSSKACTTTNFEQKVKILYG